VAPKAHLRSGAFDKAKMKIVPARARHMQLQARRVEQPRRLKDKLAQIREVQKKKKAAEILKIKDLEKIIQKPGQIQILDSGFRMPAKPLPKPHAKPKITGLATIVMHEDAALADIEIFAIRLKNGQPSGSRKVIKSTSDIRGAFEFELALSHGDHQLCVHYRGELVYGESFRLRAGETPPQFNLEITVAEETVLGLNAEGSEDDAYLVPIFGYRMRHVPACPNGQNTHNHI
jgi:hypothetical protein